MQLHSQNTLSSFHTTMSGLHLSGQYGVGRRKVEILVGSCTHQRSYTLCRPHGQISDSHFDGELVTLKVDNRGFLPLPAFTSARVSCAVEIGLCVACYKVLVASLLISSVELNLTAGSLEVNS